MLQRVIRSSIERASIADPANSWQNPTFDAEHPDDVQDEVLRVDPCRQGAVHADAANLELVHRQTLAGQDVADLTGPDAEGEAPKAPCRGMGITQATVMPGCIGPIRSDHVHDPLTAAADAVQLNVVLGLVTFKVLSISSARGSAKGRAWTLSEHVIHGRDCPLRHARSALCP